MRIRTFVAIVCVALLWLAACAPTESRSSAPAEPVTQLPAPTGPYAVGSRRFELTDLSRRGIGGDASDQPRALPGIVWHPSISSDTPRAAYLSEAEAAVQLPALGRNMEYEAELVGRLRAVVTNSVDDAAPAQGRFPLIVFSHGYFLYPGQNQILAESLASHGYVVASVSHPRDSVDLTLADGRIVQTNMEHDDDNPLPLAMAGMMIGPTHGMRTAALARYAEAFPPTRLAQSVISWRDDTLFAVHALLDEAPPQELADILANTDKNTLALVGMSFGGATSATTCRLIEQCRAAINFDGQNFDPALFNADVERPLLMVQSDWTRYPLFPGQPRSESFTPNDAAFEPWARAGETDRVTRIRIRDTQHMAFTDLALIMRNERAEELFGAADPARLFNSVNALTLAYLDWRLRSGDRAELDRLISEDESLIAHDPSAVRAWR